MRKNKTSIKDSEKAESKPDRLAKIIYDALIRMINAKNAAIRAQKPVFELDFDRKRRVNTGRNVDQ
ncbi:MAG: hypothetical protein LBP41_01710 [Holosporaceae bacterium]|jgi:hypothetical protein|nr:hypothetical protein [Holosporaceae bacterium]